MQHGNAPLGINGDRSVDLAPPSCTRRTFLSLAAVVGSLHVIGTALGGRITAYADEAGNQSFVITVVNPHEVSCLAYDVGNGKTPLEGMSVTITSKQEGREGKTASGVTDKWGIAVIDVKPLTRQADDIHASEFSMYAGWEAALSGYREIAVENTFVLVGARDDQQPNIVLATQPHDSKSGDPYVRMASFNGHDVQYMRQEMAKLPGNDIKQRLLIQVVCAPGGKAQASLLANGAVIAGPVQATADGSGRADCVLSGPWITTQNVGDAFTVAFGMVGDTVWNMPLGLQLIDPDLPYDPFDYTAERNRTAVFAMGNGAADTSADSASLNSSAKLLSNTFTLKELPISSLKAVLDLPFFPVTPYMDPYGGFGLTVSLAHVDLRTGRNSFGQTPSKNFKDWKAKQMKKAGAALDRWEKTSPAEGGKGSCEKFGGWSANFDFSLILIATLGERDKQTGDRCWTGSAKANFLFIVAGEWGRQMPGSIPWYLSLDTHFAVNASVQGGMEFNDPLDGAAWHWFLFGGAAGEGGVVIDAEAELGFSAALGVKGLFGIGIRAFARVPMTVGWVEPPATAKNKAFPHFSAALQGGGEVFFEALFFKIKQRFFSTVPHVVYDNYENGSARLSADADALCEYAAINDALRLSGGEGVWQMTTDLQLLESRSGTASLDADVPGYDRVTASVNAQGVSSKYDLSKVNAAFSRLNDSVKANRRGVFNPYAAGASLSADDSPEGASGLEGCAFDARKGLHPLTDETLTTDAFSDARFKKVQTQVGNEDVVFFCRIGLVEMDVDGLVRSSANANANAGMQVLDLDGCLFVAPRSVRSADSADSAGAPDAAADEAGVSLLPVFTFDTGDEAGSAENGEEGSLSSSGEQRLGSLKVTRQYDEVSFCLADGILDDAPCEPAAPCVAQLMVETFGDEDSVADVNDRMRCMAGLASGARNAGSFGELLGSATKSNATIVPRTRVLVTPYWINHGYFGPTDVIDFALPSADIGTLRINTNDVDFDVIADDGKLCFGIVSATRPPLRNPTFDDAKKLEFTNAVVYDPNAAVGQRVQKAFTNFAALEVQDDYEWKALPFTTTHEGRDCICMVSTGQREKLTKGKHGFIAHYYALDGTYLAANTHNVTPTGIDVNDFGTMDVVRSEALANDDAFALVWQYRDVLTESDIAESGEVPPHIDVWTVDTETGKTLGSWEIERAVNLTRIGDGERGLVFARPAELPGEDAEPDVLGENGPKEHTKLCRAYFESATEFVGNEDDAQTEIVIGKVDSSQFELSADGNHLYAMRIMEGMAEEPDDPSYRQTIEEKQNADFDYCYNESPFVPESVNARAGAAAELSDSGGAEIGFYQMLCSMWDPSFEEFHPFFAFGQLQSAPDMSASFKVEGGADVFYSTVIDLENQKAEQHFASLPYATGIQLEGVSCGDAFIEAGATVHPIVCVTNIGNQPISQFTVNFSSDGLSKSITLDALEEYVDGVFDYASSTNGRALTDESEEEMRAREYLLWPGDMRKYVMAVETPASWGSAEAHEHEVNVTVSNPVPADLYGDRIVLAAASLAQSASLAVDLAADEAEAQGEAIYPSDGMVYLVDPRKKDFGLSLEAGFDLQDDPDIGRCDYTTGAPAPTPTPTPAPSPTSAPAPAPGPAPAPNTGDSAGTMAAVAGVAAVAAVGAAVVGAARFEGSEDGE